jgi:ABC-type sugar transport system substrate-binding protein
LEINTLGAIAPFDNRHSVVEQYEKDGKIKVTQLISPSLTGGDFYSQVNTAVSTALNNYSEIQGVWSASSAFLDGVFDAMDQVGKTDLVVTAIDISDTEIQRLANREQYYCCAAVDPYVIGLVDVRLAVLKTLGVDTPETATLEAVGVFNNQVTADDSMKTLSSIFPGFGTTDLFDTDEIKDLRSKFAK